MTLRVEQKKWIIYRHTSNYELIKAVAVDVKNSCHTVVSPDDRKLMQTRLAMVRLYKERNPNKPLDAISHRINTLEYYMFGVEKKVAGKKQFTFSPLGNLFLKYIGDDERLKFIFFTMLYSMQYEHPRGSTHKSFTLYPFRLIFKLLRDPRLQYRLYNYEVEYFVVFTKWMNEGEYERLVESMLTLRSLPDIEISRMFCEDEHTYVNAAYEWEYYTKRLLRSAGVWVSHEGSLICKLSHPTNRNNTSIKTQRRVTRGFVELNPKLELFSDVMLANYPFDMAPLPLNDPLRLKDEVIDEIYSFCPIELLERIGEEEAVPVEAL